MTQTVPHLSLALLYACLAFILTALWGAWLLPRLRRWHVGQKERQDGPQSHLVKSGTPTFGGFMFLLPLWLLMVVMAFLYPASQTAALLLLSVGLAATGFADDYIKVRKNPEGLSPLQKSVPTLLICGLFTVYYLWFFPGGPVFVLPFSLKVLPVTGLGWKLLYGVFAVIYLYFIANSVNLTDGVDGLLAAVTIPAALTMGILASLTAFSGAAGSLYSSWALAGGFAGFLLYNHHKAKVFMGDTGSLAAGGLLAGVLLLQGVPWVMLLLGFIYVAESLSVIIQVTYFKRTGGRRIFRMSPIHHHFELGGWSENKVVAVFTLVTVAGCLLSLLTYWAAF
ncbi:MAG: phospho-N-acetylmuramoyl-pentapeptide-transferase [Oscillospiraceae bacterium]|nr:phospho-N-acetylmuramoyl-pentapeptide-transferase [Oscillospiraceae bacterium]